MCGHSERIIPPWPLIVRGRALPGVWLGLLECEAGITTVFRADEVPTAPVIPSHADEADEIS